MQGFIVFDYASQYASARAEISKWLSEGKLQRKETIVKGGLRAAEKALVDLYNGVNTGTFVILDLQIAKSWALMDSGTQVSF